MDGNGRHLIELLGAGGGGHRIVAATGRPDRVGAVIDAGTGLAATLDVPVRVIHVHDSPTEHVRSLADEAGVELDVRTGDVLDTLEDALAADDVLLAVVAIDSWDDDAEPPPAVGAIGRALLEGASRPVLVVPANCPSTRHWRPHRVLVPHDGTDVVATALDPTIAALRESGFEVFVQHVFDAEHVPAFVDHPYWGVACWGHEFQARHDDRDLRARHDELDHDLLLGSGRVAEHVLTAVDRRQVDLVVLGWSQDLSPGRGAVVRELLEHAPVPLLLVPVAEPTAAPPRTGVVPIAIDGP